MWIFTRYGFFSIACPKIAYAQSDSLQQDRLMIRARRRQHLESLQARFPELSSLEIEVSPKLDYRYRLLVAKQFWEHIASELVREQIGSNFEDDAENFTGAGGQDYSKALHQVRSLMRTLQSTEPANEGPSVSKPPSDENALTWDGLVDPTLLKDDPVRQTLANQARAYEWPGVFQTLAEHPALINTARPGGKARFAPLHQAALAGAEVGVVERLVSLGAWRSLRNADGERAVDIARQKGHSHLIGALEPTYKQHVANATLAAIQGRFHELIRQIARKSENLWLPELEPMLEYEPRIFWFAVPGMCGGFRYWLAADGPSAHLAAQSWSRVFGGSGRHHDISEHQTRLIDHSFV